MQDWFSCFNTGSFLGGGGLGGGQLGLNEDVLRGLHLALLSLGLLRLEVLETVDEEPTGAGAQEGVLWGIWSGLGGAGLTGTNLLVSVFGFSVIIGTGDETRDWRTFESATTLLADLWGNVEDEKWEGAAEAGGGIWIGPDISKERRTFLSILNFDGGPSFLCEVDFVLDL